MDNSINNGMVNNWSHNRSSSFIAGNCDQDLTTGRDTVLIADLVQCEHDQRVPSDSRTNHNMRKKFPTKNAKPATNSTGTQEFGHSKQLEQIRASSSLGTRDSRNFSEASSLIDDSNNDNNINIDININTDDDNNAAASSSLSTSLKDKLLRQRWRRQRRKNNQMEQYTTLTASDGKINEDGQGGAGAGTTTTSSLAHSSMQKPTIVVVVESNQVEKKKKTSSSLATKLNAELMRNSLWSSESEAKLHNNKVANKRKSSLVPIDSTARERRLDDQYQTGFNRSTAPTASLSSPHWFNVETCAIDCNTEEHAHAHNDNANYREQQEQHLDNREKSFSGPNNQSSLVAKQVNKINKQGGEKEAGEQGGEETSIRLSTIHEIWVPEASNSSRRLTKAIKSLVNLLRWNQSRNESNINLGHNINEDGPSCGLINNNNNNKHESNCSFGEEKNYNNNDDATISFGCGLMVDNLDPAVSLITTQINCKSPHHNQETSKEENGNDNNIHDNITNSASCPTNLEEVQKLELDNTQANWLRNTKTRLTKFVNGLDVEEQLHQVGKDACLYKFAQPGRVIEDRNLLRPRSTTISHSNNNHNNNNSPKHSILVKLDDTKVIKNTCGKTNTLKKQTNLSPTKITSTICRDLSPKISASKSWSGIEQGNFPFDGNDNPQCLLARIGSVFDQLTRTRLKQTKQIEGDTKIGGSGLNGHREGVCFDDDQLEDSSLSIIKMIKSCSKNFASKLGVQQTDSSRQVMDPNTDIKKPSNETKPNSRQMRLKANKFQSSSTSSDFGDSNDKPERLGDQLESKSFRNKLVRQDDEQICLDDYHEQFNSHSKQSNKTSNSLIIKLNENDDLDQDTNKTQKDANGGQEKKSYQDERDIWGKNIEFLLAVIGFAVDLGNVWRFPYVCYKNGGGAFLIPYTILFVLGGLPIFYMEMSLGQYFSSGCLTIWSRVCPIAKGIGYSMCLLNFFTGLYYNTIISWAVYFCWESFTTTNLPWTSCNNSWNLDSCRTIEQRQYEKQLNNQSHHYDATSVLNNDSNKPFPNSTITTPTQDYYKREVLQVHLSTGIEDLGEIRKPLAIYLAIVFVFIYFAIWKGVKSTGKAVWITALLPYFILIPLLIRGVFLPGAWSGIKYYLSPQWESVTNMNVWIEAAKQIYFSLGPGFGTLMALSSYNKFHHNTCKDAMIAASVNYFASFISGFVIFSVLGYMAVMSDDDISHVANEGPGLVFEVYPEGLATMQFASLWSGFFFMMVVTLGIDSTFGGLESVITGLCDEYPRSLRRHRGVFIGILILIIYVCSIPTTTNGGQYVIFLLETYGTSSLLLIVLVETIVVCWIYGTDKFCSNLQEMSGHVPSAYWRICWKYISPTILLVIFLAACGKEVSNFEKLEYNDNYVYPNWAPKVGLIITCSPIFCIPAYAIYHFVFKTKGSLYERLRSSFEPLAQEREHDVGLSNDAPDSDHEGRLRSIETTSDGNMTPSIITSPKITPTGKTFPDEGNRIGLTRSII